MHWLVDGYNGIRCDPEMKSRDAVRLVVNGHAGELQGPFSQVARRLGLEGHGVLPLGRG